MVYVAAMSRI